MSSNDSSSDLDSRISTIVENTVGRMRDELMHRMQDTESRLREITSHLRGEDEIAPAAEPVMAAAPEPAGETRDELFDSVAEMDRGSSQQEVLAALLEGVGRFAGRSALFLTRSDAAQGWGSYGFDDSAGEIQQAALSYSEGPLAVLAEGRGCVVLTADDCAGICRQIGARPAAEGLLIPFVLRDRLAATLYVDRFADDPPLARRSLQLLAYVGAQAVEGLALRKRADTPTLKVAETEAETPGVALWDAPAATPAEPAAAAPPAPEISAEPSAVSPPPLTAPPVSAPQLTEPAPEPAPTALPAELTLDDLPAEPPTAMVAEPPPVVEPVPEAAAAEDWQLPDLPSDPPMTTPPAEVGEPLDALVEPPVETPVEAPAEEAPPWAASAGSEFSMPEAETPPPPVEMATPAREPSGASAGDSTEVRPPTDVSGPGWAFTASRAAAETGDDAQHEEARRLARLLVTEIKLYNEEQVEEGRRGNDIYARLREDIDRSRQIFNERVDEDVRQENDYFLEEMVRILGGGNAEALGL